MLNEEYRIAKLLDVLFIIAGEGISIYPSAPWVRI